MALDIIVTVKQVPDTREVSKDAMKPDGTVNRTALPAIFNPEDLNALETALEIRESQGGTVTAITMGPPGAIEVLRECLYRGTDDAVLLSDRGFAGSDTLATSYVLKKAIEKLGRFDLILCGRQAIDGDTAQVGPQIAEKLDLNQITCVSEIREIDENGLTTVRNIEGGHEVVTGQFPLLLTITKEANTPRFPNAKSVMKFKKISTCIGDGPFPSDDPDLGIGQIREWNADLIAADPDRCGFSGSPTKVKKVENVVLTETETVCVSDSDKGVRELIQKLIRDNIIG